MRHLPCALVAFAITFITYAAIPNGWHLPAQNLKPLAMAPNSLSVTTNIEGDAAAAWLVPTFPGDSFPYNTVGVNFYFASNDNWNPFTFRLSETVESEDYNVSSAPILRMIKSYTMVFLMWRQGGAAPYSPVAAKMYYGYDPSFRPVALIADPGQRSLLPLMQVAINEIGDALFVYSKGNNYVSSFYSDNVFWTDWIPTDVTTTISNTARDKIDLALSDNGKALACYISSINNKLYASEYTTSTSSWGAVQPLSTLPTTQPTLIMNHQTGIAYLLWIENGQTLNALQYNPSNWPTFTIKTIAAVGGPATIEQGSMCMDTLGNVTFMWSSKNTPFTTSSLTSTYYDSSAPWASWIPSITILATSAHAPISQWALGAQPAFPYTIFALWEVADGPLTYYVKSNQAINGTWSGSPQTTYALDNNRAIEQQIHVDAAGNALATWYQTTKQPSITTVIISAMWYDADTGLWQTKTTPLSGAGCCDCTSI